MSACHCGKPTNNPTGTLCDVHIDELRAFQRRRHEDYLATMRAAWRYFIPDGDLGVEWRDGGRWRSYEISGAQGQTQAEFFEALTISEVDQDGGELRTYGFEDAPGDVQAAILKAVGIGRAEVAS